MKRITTILKTLAVAVAALVFAITAPSAWAADKKPNIITIISDDFGYGDAGVYGYTPEKGVVGIPFFDAYVEKAALDYLDRNAKSDKPFFMFINFMKVHQPNMPHPDYVHKSLSKSKYADSVVENDARIGHIMDKIRALELGQFPDCETRGPSLTRWPATSSARQSA